MKNTFFFYYDHKFYVSKELRQNHNYSTNIQSLIPLGDYHRLKDEIESWYYSGTFSVKNCILNSLKYKAYIAFIWYVCDECIFENDVEMKMLMDLLEFLEENNWVRNEEIVGTIVKKLIQYAGSIATNGWYITGTDILRSKS